MKVVYSPEHEKHDPGLEFRSSALGMVEHPERPVRARSILASLQNSDLFEIVVPEPCALEVLRVVHDAGMLAFLQRCSEYLQKAAAHPSCRSDAVVDRDRCLCGQSHARPRAIIPDSFALRRLDRKPATLLDQAGYYCSDAQTPIVVGTWDAAVAAVSCALTGAKLLLAGERTVYAVCRPPGHHAGRDYYGGYCYLNNAAIAAYHLSQQGKVAVLDIDYHHGNGTQDIFYDSDRVLFVSLHADPNYAYPFYSGYEDEMGTGKGRGCNRNYPLAKDMGEAGYLEVFERAMADVTDFNPDSLVVSLGVDTAAGDPIGDLGLSVEAFREMGAGVGAIGKPIVTLLEGGYGVETASLRSASARAFLLGKND